MNPLSDVDQVLEYYQNLNLGVKVDTDSRNIIINGTPVLPETILRNLSKPGMTWAAKVKYLANIAGVMDYEIEAILSNFEDMKSQREQLFCKWFQQGRPDTHIFRG